MSGEGGEKGERDWEFGISRCELVYIDWNKVLQYTIVQRTVFDIL